MKKSPAKNKKVTIDDLAIMVQNGFREQTENTKFMINGLEIKVDRLDKSVFNLGQKVDSMDERLKMVEKTLNPLLLVMDVMKTGWKDHEMRIIKLEKNLQTK